MIRLFLPRFFHPLLPLEFELAPSANKGCKGIAVVGFGAGLCSGGGTWGVMFFAASRSFMAAILAWISEDTNELLPAVGGTDVDAAAVAG